MDGLSRRTLRNGAVGAVVGTVLGFVPIVLLIAPLVGGAVAGYLERDGARRGAIAGSVAGVLMAALSAIVVAIVLFVRFGDLPFAAGPIETLAIATVLSLVAAVLQIVVAGIGGGLAGLLEADRPRARAGEQASGRDGTVIDEPDRGRDTADAAPTSPTGSAPPRAGGRARSLVVVAASLVAGVVTFGVVALAVTTVLDPFIWPSAIVGVPLGFVAGAAVTVVGYYLMRRPPERETNWRALGAGTLAILLVFGLAIGGLYLLGQQRIAASTESTYEYEVAIATDDSIENATFYLPIPTTDGRSDLGEHFVESVRYDRDTPALEGYDPDHEPVEFTYELVETEHGPMLAISTERIEVTRVYYRTVENGTMGWHERIDPEAYDPDDPDLGVQDDGRFRFSVTVAANDTVETADPFGSEPLLEPKSDLRESDCLRGPSETQRCFEYESLVYASYESDEETTVSVATSLSGRNEWFAGGWSGNEYRERTAVEVTGPQTGWTVTTGDLEVGIGSYRR